MFFPKRIKSIKPNDRVLEIGPGGTPYYRADVFLEKLFSDPKVAEGQRGYAPELKTDKNVVYYDGSKFPFRDKEFDYVICSHVLEHVEDVDAFIAEINRVGKAGYLEYPLVYYDYIYNFPEHISFIKKKETEIIWMPKEEAGLSKFKAVNVLFYESLKSRYTSLVDDLKEYFFEGFEWFEVIKSCRTSAIEDLIINHIDIPIKKPKLNLYQRLKQLMKL